MENEQGSIKENLTSSAGIGTSKVSLARPFAVRLVVGIFRLLVAMGNGLLNFAGKLYRGFIDCDEDVIVDNVILAMAGGIASAFAIYHKLWILGGVLLTPAVVLIIFLMALLCSKFWKLLKKYIPEQ